MTEEAIYETAPFEGFPKIPRLKHTCVITEKIDGTNAQILVPSDPEQPLVAGSRNRYVTPEKDNFGFARWVADNEAMLRRLGPGRHFGEWWGAGIQRRYGLPGKRFWLFNSGRWTGKLPEGLPPEVGVVPVLYHGDFQSDTVDKVLADLATSGSVAAPGFMQPEGIVVFLPASGSLYKVTLDGDGHKEQKEPG